jgi:hypothetical protein
MQEISGIHIENAIVVLCAYYTLQPSHPDPGKPPRNYTYSIQDYNHNTHLHSAKLFQTAGTEGVYRYYQDWKVNS